MTCDIGASEHSPGLRSNREIPGIDSNVHIPTDVSGSMSGKTSGDTVHNYCHRVLQQAHSDAPKM